MGTAIKDSNSRKAPTAPRPFLSQLEIIYKVLGPLSRPPTRGASSLISAVHGLGNIAKGAEPVAPNFEKHVFTPRLEAFLKMDPHASLGTNGYFLYQSTL